MDLLEQLMAELASNDDFDFLRPILIPYGVAERLVIEVTWKDGSTCRYYQQRQPPFHWEIGVAHQPALCE